MYTTLTLNNYTKRLIIPAKDSPGYNPEAIRLVVARQKKPDLSKGLAGLHCPDVGIYAFEECINAFTKKAAFEIKGAKSKHDHINKMIEWAFSLKSGSYILFPDRKNPSALGELKETSLSRPLISALHHIDDPQGGETKVVATRKLGGLLKYRLAGLINTHLASKEAYNNALQLVEKFEVAMDLCIRGATPETISAMEAQFENAFEESGLSDALPLAGALNMMKGEKTKIKTTKMTFGNPTPIGAICPLIVSPAIVKGEKEIFPDSEFLPDVLGESQIEKIYG